MNRSVEQERKMFSIVKKNNTNHKAFQKRKVTKCHKNLC